MDNLTLATFYKAVMQAMLFFGAEMWVLSTAMDKCSAGVHMGFLQHVTGKNKKRILDGTWIQEGAERILKVARKQAVRKYIDRRQVTVDHWLDLRTILEVCAQKRQVTRVGGG